MDWSLATPTTIGDDSVKQTVIVEALGGSAVVQTEPLFRATNPAEFARGNVRGDVVFTAQKSHATYAAAFSYLVTQYGYLGGQGDLKFTEPSTHYILFANATLKGVERASWNGVELAVRYRFSVRAVSYA